MRIFIYSTIVILSVLFSGSSIAATKTEKRQARAVRAETAPVIDGDLSDGLWKQAPWHTGFVQWKPDNGAKGSQKTKFAVAYDDEALYVAARCSVPNRESIVTRLVRRDKMAEFDILEIILAPRGDGRTGYSFMVNPHGVQIDQVWKGDFEPDVSWDAVWYAETQILDDQWTVEMAIPLDQIRFPEGKESWGFQVVRWIASNQELDIYSPVHPEAPGWISSAGDLVDTEEIPARNPLSFTPETYFSYRSSTEGYGGRAEDGVDFGIGGYAKIGLAPDLVLDLALNPDFGQVEVDEVVLNLTAYETQFPEKRPFFLENAGLFQTPIQLFYSRRFGASPPDPELGDSEWVKSGPNATPILSAFKLTGRTSNGISVGVLDAVFLPTQFRIHDDDTGRSDMRQSTPWTNATALRLVGEVGQSSTVGVLATALKPAGSDGSYSGGVDLNLLTPDRMYSFRGQVAGSVRFDGVPGQDETHGGALWVQLAREGGETLRVWALYELYSKGFDSNDLGYLWRPGFQKGFVHVQLRRQKPMGPFNAAFLGLGLELFMDTEGLDLGRQFFSYFITEWKSHWSSELGAFGTLPRYDDYETRGGPDMKRPAVGGGWLDVVTPAEKVLGATLHTEMANTAFGYRLDLNVALLVRLGRLELEMGPGIGRKTGEAAFVETFTPEDQVDEITIIGQRELDSLNFTFKGTFVILRDLTLQFQSQLLGVRADYSHYEHLLDDSSTVPYDYPYDAESDFSVADLSIQGLVRWQFLPGSALYLVYTHLGFVERYASGIGLNKSLSNLDDEEREQVLMLKLSYMFD